MFENEDFYGTELRNPDDPLVKQAQDLFAHAAKSAVPFTVRSFAQRRADQDTTTTNAVESFFGITPAPASVTRTKAQNLIRKYTPEFHRTTAQADASEQTRAIRNGLRSKTPEGRQAAREAAESGIVTRRQIENAERTAGMTPLQSGFQRLSLGQALNVYEVATETERAQLIGLLRRKGNRVDASAPQDRPGLEIRLRAAGRLPIGKWQIPVTARE
jgi:hypothetical protein